jgi:hypothetical protein
MAQTYICDTLDGRPAAALVTNLENGDTLALCEECWHTFVKATAERLDGAQGAPEPAHDSIPADVAMELVSGAEEAAAEFIAGAAPEVIAVASADAAAVELYERSEDTEAAVAMAAFPEPEAAPEPSPASAPAAGKKRGGARSHAGGAARGQSRKRGG